MHIVMTPEQVASSERDLVRLRSTDLLVDWITAAIMDPTIGGSGLYEGSARSKAIHILAKGDIST